MPTFYDSRNQPHVLLNRLGSGGEGTVYTCEGDYKLVAKIYSEPITEEKAEKLRWMAANKNERLLRVAAWVVDVLRDAPGGRVVGFLMPNVNAKEIHELYSLKSRRIYFPEATWHFLVNTAANVARAFYALHRDAHIMGDVNHGNCVVMRDGTVKLIDCDSYSIKTEKQRYKCEVGVATHLAPELQGVNLHAVQRENKHDNFGLAVIIFQLLFLGRHPFAGNYPGAEDKSLEDCIREIRFAYGSNASIKNVRQPPGTLPLSSASPRIALLFERAFLTEDRPEPREWIEALEDLSANLERCALHPGHFYYKELAACPWCEIETQTGLMLFPFVTGADDLNGEKPFNIFTVENLIASFGIGNNLLVKAAPPPDAVLPPPSPEIIETKRNRRRLTLFVVPAYALGLIFLMWILGVGTGFYIGIMMLFFSISYLNSSHKSAAQPLVEILADEQRELEKLERERERAGVPQIIDADLVKIRKKVAEYQSVQRRSVGELKLIQTQATKREMYKYLRSKSIAEVEIDGVSQDERKHLVAAGVKTAAEIDEDRLRKSHKIDDATVPKLLEWRAALASDFDEDERGSRAVKAEQLKFVDETNAERRQIERDIEQLLILLRGGAVHLQKQQHKLLTQSERLAKQISQTKSDLHAFGSNIPAIIALILISLFVPLFVGSALPDSTARNYPAPRRASTGSGYDSPQTLNSYPKAGSNLPDENMADEDIWNLPEFKRVEYAENLYAEAVKYNYETIDRTQAEQYSRQALRFSMSLAAEPRLLNQLGYALYGQGKYVESLRHLNRSLSIEKGNSETKIFIAMNYLATKRFDEAAKLMSAVTKEFPNSFEAFYSLGLAYNGLDDYVRAQNAFQRAAEIKPGDAGIHYHLGYSFYKLKKRDELRREYEILKTLDENTAENLMADANLTKKAVAVSPQAFGH